MKTVSDHEIRISKLEADFLSLKTKLGKMTPKDEFNVKVVQISTLEKQVNELRKSLKLLGDRNTGGAPTVINMNNNEDVGE